MRDLTTVIKQMLDIIPEEYTVLREALGIYYVKGENDIESWNDIGDLLYTEIFSNFYPEVSWQSELEKIWTGDEDPEELDYSNF